MFSTEPIQIALWGIFFGALKPILILMIRLLSILLTAPSVVDGLTSPESIRTATKIYRTIHSIGFGFLIVINIHSSVLGRHQGTYLAENLGDIYINSKCISL
jgi:hypothetical protein